MHLSSRDHGRPAAGRPIAIARWRNLGLRRAQCGFADTRYRAAPSQPRVTTPVTTCTPSDTSDDSISPDRNHAVAPSGRIAHRPDPLEGLVRGNRVPVLFGAYRKPRK